MTKENYRHVKQTANDLHDLELCCQFSIESEKNKLSSISMMKSFLRTLPMQYRGPKISSYTNNTSLLKFTWYFPVGEVSVFFNSKGYFAYFDITYYGYKVEEKNLIDDSIDVLSGAVRKHNKKYRRSLNNYARSVTSCRVK